MIKMSLVNPAAFVAFLVATATACSQDEPMSGTYQIQSGTFHEEGGLVGTFLSLLPNRSQAYVSLRIGSGTGTAVLTFLDASLHPSLRPITNGTVSGNTIVFQYVAQTPPQQIARVDYTVASSAGHLWISGSITSAPACCDVPYLVEHKDVRAAQMPVMSIRPGSPVELRWSSISNQIYQVQYQTNLAPLGWTNLGGPVPGNGRTNFMADGLGPTHSQRFYRVLAVP